MKQEMAAWKNGRSGEQPLYDTFVDMHTNSRNAVWHYTSVFPFAHKAMLWLYESALIYTGIKNQMFSSDSQACSWGLPYWAWETAYDYDQSDDIIPVYQASVFSDADLNGDASVDNTTGYVLNGYFARPEWVLMQEICSKDKTHCDKKLKRLLDATNIYLDPTQVMQKITSTPEYIDLLPWLHSSAHSPIHLFLSYSMQTPASPDEPMFFLHHTNIDRLLHLWGDCHEYDKVDPNSLTSTHYTSINPTDANSVDNHLAADESGTPYDVSLDSVVPLYVSGTAEFIYCTSTEFPTIRQMWTLGNSTHPGWNGLYYRYGPDGLASSALASACADGNNWTWVNYAESSKRSQENPTADDLLYQNLTAKFNELLNEGISPRDALDELAMRSCNSNPRHPFNEDNKKYLRTMGVNFRALKRICDELIEDENEIQKDTNTPPGNEIPKDANTPVKKNPKDTIDCKCKCKDDKISQ